MARSENKISRLQSLEGGGKAPVVEDAADVASKLPAPSATPVDSQVVVPRRRRFTAEYKRQVLAEADACTEPGELGAMLRRHGLYSSHLTDWRRQREAGELSGLTPKKRGRKVTAKNPLAAEVARLEQENKRLLARAERAERLVALQKKVAELFGETLPPPPPELATPEPPPPATRKKH
jgi:transposase-like protein